MVAKNFRLSAGIASDKRYIGVYAANVSSGYIPVE
jgi:hypothetical protein